MDRTPAAQADAEDQSRQAAKRLEKAFSRHQDELLGMLRYVVGNAEDARNALQDAFLECWKRRDSIAEIDDLRAWIFRTALGAGRNARWKDREPADAETRRQLLELVYDLLPEDEAIEWRRRMESDPDLAAAHREVQDAVQTFAKTDRLPAAEGWTAWLEQLDSRKKTSGGDPAGAGPRSPAGKGSANATKPFARAAGWAVGLAAAALMAISIGGYAHHRERLAAIAAEHLRLIVAGPSRLQAGVASEYTILATTIGGRPAQAQIEVTLLTPDGRRLKTYQETADERGRLRIALPADIALDPKLPPRVRLTIAAQYRDCHEDVEALLTVDPIRYRARLMTDRSLYRPGEVVFFRATVIAGVGLEADRRLPVHFEMLDPKGVAPRGASSNGIVRRGVADGSFSIPADASEGRYTLLVRADDRSFPEIRRSFWVRHDRPIRSKEKRTPEKAVHGRNAIAAKLTPPKGVKKETKPPDGSAGGNVVLNAGEGVFAAGAPLTFDVTTAKTGLPLVAAAYCRGMLVGAQPLTERPGDGGRRSVALPLNDIAGGMIRLVVYDDRLAPPKPAAERWVYRQPSRRLQVRFLDPPNRYKPGENVHLAILVTDEQDRPVPAILGATVLATTSAGGIPARSLDAADVENDIEAILSDASPTKPAAAKAIGSLLAAHAPQGAVAPPFTFDNLDAIRSDYEKCLADYQADRTPLLSTLTAASFFGGLGLILLVAMMGLLGIASGLHLWIPAVGATICSLVLGAILTDPARSAPERDNAAAFASYAPPASATGESEEPESADRPSAGGPTHQKADAANEPDDFAQTLLWRPIFVAEPDGHASLRFQLPAGESAFSIDIEAQKDGRLGAAKMTGETKK